MLCMPDDEYFKYVEPLSPEGMERLNGLINAADTLDDELTAAVIANDAFEKDRETLEELGSVFEEILAEYKAAMNGEAVSETWERDILHAEKSLLECP